MSMPKFPEIDPEITCDRALNLILTSIAMEELALSHIINAEGEKLQFVLGTLETSEGRKHDIDEVLKVNQSITSLLDIVSQNQMILKNKMDKALHALVEICPGRPGPPGPPGPQGPEGPPGKCHCKCSAAFKAAEKCRLWCGGSALHWDIEHMDGSCVCLDPCDTSKIELRAKGRFVIHFSINVRSKPNCKSNAAISLQMANTHQCTDVYTVHSQVPADTMATMSMGGVIIEVPDYHKPPSLFFKLLSPDSLKVGDSMLSIIEI